MISQSRAKAPPMNRLDVQRAALSIRLRITDHSEMVVQAGPDKRIVVSGNLSRERLKSLLASMRPELERFQQGFVALQESNLRDVGNALGLLHRKGRHLLYALFGDDDEKLIEASALCKEACSTWDSPGWDFNPLAPKIIEIRTSLDYGIPFDLLPLFDLDKPRPVNTMDDVARVAGAFLGFSSVVKRHFPGISLDYRTLRIDNLDSFAVKMFWNVSLPGAHAAKSFFVENGLHFDLKGGPWPNGTEAKDEFAFCEEVARFLSDPNTSFDGDTRHGKDHLCYFYCDCDTSSGNYEDHALFLGSGKWYRSHCPVRLYNLKDELHLHNQKNLRAGRVFASRPLVFLNACGSASLDPSSAGSFPELFLSGNMGFLGYIGTEATVPEVFGRIFAEVFYRNFVGGLPLGQALYKTRWYMLRKFRSPLGLLYTLFADPEIEVRNKISHLRERLSGSRSDPAKP